jgi:hypothetical protein
MKWATRKAIHIDRAACAWLIRRFLDPEAEFVFVTDPADVPAEATPFDMRRRPGPSRRRLQPRDHPPPLRVDRSRVVAHRRDHPRSRPRRRTL